MARPQAWTAKRLAAADEGVRVYALDECQGQVRPIEVAGPRRSRAPTRCAGRRLAGAGGRR
jgi:hypothetical protein